MGYPVKKVSADALKHTLKELDASAEQFGDLTGINPHTLKKWVRENEMPAYMRWVCEGVRASKSDGAKRDMVMLIRAPRSEREMLNRFMDAIGGKVQEVQ